MNFVKNNLANALTLANLLCGSIGVIQLLYGNYEITALCLIGSLVFDFFDGFTARALKADSKIGGELDSLADMVSFGLLPGTALFLSLQELFPEGNSLSWLKYGGLLVTLFSALRLAIFNLDEEQKYYFKGLNTPSNTLLIFGMYYCFQKFGSFALVFENPWLLLALSIVLSWLLVSSVKMISLKFKSSKLQDNYSKLVLAGGIILLLILFGLQGIPYGIIYYIAISLIFKKELTH